MKTIKTTFLAVLLLVFAFNLSQAQQAYKIHQDNVRPSMIKQYEETAKTFNEACKKYNPQAPWVTAMTDDFRYLYISPMENFADLDKRPFADMAKAMGDDWGKLFDEFDKCYDSHNDYVIVLDEALTYMPDGISMTQEGQDYRRWIYMYYTPENSKKVREGMKAVKELFASKGSKEHYRVYRSGFGCSENFYLVAVSAKDEIDSAVRGKANQEVLGPDRWDTFNKLMNSITRMEEISGTMRPDLAYAPK